MLILSAGDNTSHPVTAMEPVPLTDVAVTPVAKTKNNKDESREQVFEISDTKTSNETNQLRDVEVVGDVIQADEKQKEKVELVPMTADSSVNIFNTAEEDKAKGIQSTIIIITTANWL